MGVSAGPAGWAGAWQAEPPVQAAQRGGGPPVGGAEQGHGGRDQEAADQGGVDGDGDGQGQAEFLDAHGLPGGEAEEHDDDQARGRGDDPVGALQAGGDRVVGIAGLFVGLLDPGQQEHLSPPSARTLRRAGSPP
jgi:hypothetical protein